MYVVRKKVWEIDSAFTCPIMGTCLTISDTKKILKRYGKLLNLTKYEAHNAAVSYCSDENQVSKAINKTLDSTYSKYIEDIKKLDSHEELSDYWKSHFEKGNIAGPLWAIVSSRNLYSDICNEVYADVHMLSHESVHEILNLKSRICSMKNTIRNLQDDKYRYKKAMRELNREIIGARGDKRKIQFLEEKLKRYEKKYSQKEHQRDDHSILFSELCKVIRINKADKNKLYRTKSELQDQRNENKKLMERIKLLEEELKIKENPSLLKTRDNKTEITELECTNISCPSYNLEGKTILYVGGRPSVINHCREVIENCGGKFIHHDGGISESVGKIPNIIDNVDSVFFPVDCISHNASSSVKKICRKNRKNLIYLKNSSISTFTREIEKAFGDQE